jgi:hypothetical protein
MPVPIQSASHFAAGASTNTVALTATTAGTLLILGIRTAPDVGITAIADNQTQSYTLVKMVAQGSWARMALYHILGGAAGVTTITVSLSAATDSWIAVAEYATPAVLSDANSSWIPANATESSVALRALNGSGSYLLIGLHDCASTFGSQAAIEQHTTLSNTALADLVISLTQGQTTREVLACALGNSSEMAVAAAYSLFTPSSIPAPVKSKAQTSGSSINSLNLPFTPQIGVPSYTFDGYLGNMVVVALRYSHGTTVVSLTDNQRETYGLIHIQDDGTTIVALYGLDLNAAPARSGVTSITVTFSRADPTPWMAAIEYVGPWFLTDQSGGAGTSTSASTGPMTAGVSERYLAVGLITAGAATLTPGSPAASEEGATGVDLEDYSIDLAAAATATADSTASPSAVWVAAGALFSRLSGAGFGSFNLYINTSGVVAARSITFDPALPTTVEADSPSRWFDLHVSSGGALGIGDLNVRPSDFETIVVSAFDIAFDWGAAHYLGTVLRVAVPRDDDGNLIYPVVFYVSVYDPTYTGETDDRRVVYHADLLADFLTLRSAAGNLYLGSIELTACGISEGTPGGSENIPPAPRITLESPEDYDLFVNGV